MRPSFLKTIALAPEGTDPTRDTIAALAELINTAVNGALPHDIQTLFCDGNLLAILNGHKIRPIAVGLILQRLLSKSWPIGLLENTATT